MSETALVSAARPVPSLPGRETMDIGGVETRVHDWGSGPETVLFVYGGNFGSADSASSTYAWNLNFVPLAERFRVVAFDKIGQGYTGMPLRDADYTMAAVVAHLRDVVVAKKLPPVHVVGHSRGGFAAARLALEFPDLVRSLTIVTSGTLSPGVGTNEVALSGPPHPPFSRESGRWVYANYCYRPETVTDDWLDVVVDVLNQPVYRQGVRKMAEEKLGVRLFLPHLTRYKRETLRWIEEGRLQRPTQIVWGQNDRTAIVDRGLELFSLIAAHERRTTFTVFNEAGHFSYREHPERFNALLAGFVDLYRGDAP